MLLLLRGLLFVVEMTRMPTLRLATMRCSDNLAVIKEGHVYVVMNM